MIITVEGNNGTYKTTLVAELAKALQEKGYNAESIGLPGYKQVELCKYIRALLTKPIKDPYTKLFLYLADMTECYANLDPTKLWILDRSFVSTLVYQTRDGIPEKLIYSLIQASKIYLDGVILLTADAQTCLDRLNKRQSKTVGGYHSKDIQFYTDINKAYLDIVPRYFEINQYLILDSSKLNFANILSQSLNYIVEQQENIQFNTLWASLNSGTNEIKT